MTDSKLSQPVLDRRANSEDALALKADAK